MHCLLEKKMPLIVSLLLCVIHVKNFALVHFGGYVLFFQMVLMYILFAWMRLLSFDVRVVGGFMIFMFVGAKGEIHVNEPF